MLLALLHFIGEPILHNQYLKFNITLKEYMLIYFGLNTLVNIGIGIVSYREGRFNYGIKWVSALIIVNALMTYFCLEAYPSVAIVSNIVLFFSGIFIFGFGMVSIKKAIFKKGVGLGFVILGFSFLIRFPMFMDVIYFYLNRYPVANITPLEGYYLGALYYNYIIIFLTLISLNFIIKENMILDRYIKKEENEFLR